MSDSPGNSDGAGNSGNAPGQENVFENPPAEPPVFGEVQDDNGKKIGHACAKTLKNNVVTDVDVVFYVDLAYPIGDQDGALETLQTGLVDQVSEAYGISDGLKCESPPFDGRSWIVQFVSRIDDYQKVDLFGTKL